MSIRWIGMAAFWILNSLAIASAGEPAWPNWMGPQRNGISRETGWSSQWPDTGLPVVWSREIGIGCSTTIILPR